MHVWVQQGSEGWRGKVLQQLQSPMFNTTASLFWGESIRPPDVAIVERCEPAAVKSPQEDYRTVKEEGTVIVVGDGLQFGTKL